MSDASLVADDELLAEQQAYYRARAPEYDEWWTRQGAYDRGEEDAVEWNCQVDEVADALARFDPIGDVLEFAGGTGWWTQRLALTARSLTVIDGSAETLALNQQRVGRDDIEYIVADIFDWRPTRRYDVVFFSFWLSHVPRAKFRDFWSLVRDCLLPDGRVFLIDNRHDPLAPNGTRDPFVIERTADLHRRRTKDGSEFRVVKVMYQPAELAAAIEVEGWTASIDATRWFLFGHAYPEVAL